MQATSQEDQGAALLLRKFNKIWFSHEIEEAAKPVSPRRLSVAREQLLLYFRDENSLRADVAGRPESPDPEEWCSFSIKPS
jgi:hypothetical protein